MKEGISNGYQEIKQVATNFVKAMKVGNEPGVYKKDPTENKPSWYGSYHAAHILDMFGELSSFSESDIDAWADMINQKQCDQGYYSNNDDDKHKERIPGEMDPVWHFTRGMIWTLRVLGKKPAKELKFLEPLLNKDSLYKYVKRYDWSNSWAAGNQICALSTTLMALRDWYGVPYVDELLEYGMFPALEELLDPKTGYWGCDKGASLLNGQFGTIHVLPTYFSQGWEYKYVQQSVDTTLQTQFSDGSFWPCGSDCPDFDGAYMLYNLFHLTDYRKEDLQSAANLYLNHATFHIPENKVGFLIHRKDSNPSQWVSRPHFVWEEGKSHATEELRDDDPDRMKIMLGSWFYPLSIALANEVAEDTSRFAGPYRLCKMSQHECNVTDQFCV